MKTDIEKLERIIKEQAKQIESLKKAVSSIQNRLVKVSQKTDRTYQTGRKNTNEINNIAGILRRNG